MKKSDIEKAMKAGTALAYRERTRSEPIKVTVEGYDSQSGCWFLRNADTGEPVTIFTNTYGGWRYSESRHIPSRTIVGPYDEVVAKIESDRVAREASNLREFDRRERQLDRAMTYQQEIQDDYPNCVVRFSRDGLQVILEVPEVD